jgi:tRNA pseudouridine55 synthase
MIYGMTQLSYDWPNLSIDVHCGRGTYVRSLARDIGEKLGAGGGYLTALRRTAVGDFTIGDSVRPETLGSVDDVVARLKTV